MAIILGLFVLLTSGMAFLLQAFANKVIEESAYRKLAYAGRSVSSELEAKTSVAETLVWSLADLNKMSGLGEELLIDLAVNMLDQPGIRELVAGGGIWPEPYAYNPNFERFSFFWGRGESGELQLFDDYNEASGAGYHNEEWYVPTRHLKPDQVYWSKSYTDPYSQQAMVTVSAPVYRGVENVGATTIDLKLEGLKDLLAKVSMPFEGYAYALDRNGRLLSFPDDDLARKSEDTLADDSLIPNRTLEELSLREEQFRWVNEKINGTSYQVSDGSRAEFDSLQSELVRTSYQISGFEAEGIAAQIMGLVEQNHNGKGSSNNFYLKDDYFFRGPAFVSINTLPKTQWKIVTVMPESYARKDMQGLLQAFMLILVVALMISIGFIWWWLRRSFTLPVTELTNQLQESSSGKIDSEIECKDKGELGALAHWFNFRTRELIDSRKKVDHLAYYDSLTELPNRRYLNEFLEKTLTRCAEDDCRGTLFFLDLDNFKILNDTMGHSFGDKLLIQVGERLRRCFSDSDMVSRIGGDEFVIVSMSKFSSESLVNGEAQKQAEAIIDEFTYPFTVNGNHYYVSTSVGVVVFDCSEGSSEELIRNADTAMYDAKASGRSNYCLFEPTMLSKVKSRHRIEKDLRVAIQQNELFLEYQPQVDHYGHCDSIECLVRWRHPEDGLISPAKFIPVAEESALILALGEWVFENACEQLALWKKQGFGFSHISLNVSPKQFAREDFVPYIHLLLFKYDIKPSWLMLEITEGVIIESPESVVEKIRQLKALGVKISIDDFGTGYSSLRYLKMIPLNELKIDRSFVSELAVDDSDVAIVETIIAMSQKLGFNVIAEGVESAEQYKILKEKGCMRFQGYFFSRPLSKKSLEEYLLSQSEYCVVGENSSEAQMMLSLSQ